MGISDAELDAKLAVVSRRMQAQRDRRRELIASKPELVLLAEACLETFGAELAYFRIDGIEYGKNIEPNEPISIREPDKKPRRHRNA